MAFKSFMDNFRAEWAHQLLFIRSNPGGSSQMVDGAVYGHAGAVDLTGIVDPSSKQALLRVKVGISPAVAKMVNFSSVVNITQVTAAETVAALTAAGFPGVTFSVESSGPSIGRVAGKLTTPFVRPAIGIYKYYYPMATFIQVYGDLAGALQFGDCRKQQGRGAYFLPYHHKGDVDSIIGTINYDDDSSIEHDDGLGNVQRDTYPGGRADVTLEIIGVKLSKELEQLVNGGTLLLNQDATPQAYLPPSATDKRVLSVDVFGWRMTTERQAITSGQGDGQQLLAYLGGTGRTFEDTSAGSWSLQHSTLNVSNHVNAAFGEADKDRKSPVEIFFTNAEFELANILALPVEDWEAILP